MKTLFIVSSTLVFTFVNLIASAAPVVVVPLGGDTYRAGAAKTGQSLCFEPPVSFLVPNPVNCADTGQDGEHQAGVAWPDPRFTDNGNGTVKDNLSGLIWLKNANCIATQIPNYDQDSAVGDGKVTRGNALDFISGLNIGGIVRDDGAMFRTGCGETSNNGNPQSDWRLPNRFELESLLDLSEMAPSLPLGHPFTDVETDDYYWTSSYIPYFVDLGAGWTVSFHSGDVSPRNWVQHSPEATSHSYVWPVRGGVQ